MCNPFGAQIGKPERHIEIIPDVIPIPQEEPRPQREIVPDPVPEPTPERTPEEVPVGGAVRGV